MVHEITDDEIRKVHDGELTLIDDIGDGHKVTIDNLNALDEDVQEEYDTVHVAVTFHGPRTVQEAISREDFRVDDGKTADNFGADLILLVPGYIDGTVHEDATCIYDDWESTEAQ